MKCNSLLLLLFLSFTTCFLQAQTYEIRTVDKGNGYIGVELRVTAGTPPTRSDLITDVVFGLKWLASYNVDLENTITTNYAITKSGTRITKGIYHFQAFYADQTALGIPADWTLNTWVEVMSVKNTMNGTGTGKFEIAEPHFDLTTDPNIGISLADFTPAMAGSANQIPLPVNLIRFEAIPKTDVIMLAWATADDRNVKEFEVQRAEANVPFRTIARVPRKSNSANTYEWPDQAVEAGINYHYRLKQLDLDENAVYSETRTAYLEGTGNTIDIRPNPVDNILQVILGANIAPGTVIIKIVDTKGMVVMNRIHNLNAGRKVELDVTALANGQYFLSVENDKGLKVTKPFLKN